MMQKAPETLFNLDEFVPSLREAILRPSYDPDKMLMVALPIEEPDANGRLIPALHDRELLRLNNGAEFWSWEAKSLRALFRGNNQPPVLGDYPKAYHACFLLLDLHALEISRVLGDRRDIEMKEIYSWLRRRPDGKSTGVIHDFMWQAAALTLGMKPLSQAEFEAIMARLERSCRTFEEGPSSRNYINALRETFEQAIG
jgi:hypothetical protein